MANANLTIAAKLNFKVNENQTFNPLITFINDDTDQPIDLTGVTAKMSVRSISGCNVPCNVYDQSTNQIYKQDFTGTVTGVDGNQLQFDEIIQLRHGSYKYDLLITWPSGEQQYYLLGDFIVERTYTTYED